MRAIVDAAHISRVDFEIGSSLPARSSYFHLKYGGIFMGGRVKQGSWFLVLAMVFFMSSPANAEMYVAGQVGATLPYDLSNVEWSAGGGTANGNDLSLHNSLMYGAKFGYYFDSLKWLGVETEVFNSTPHVKQQEW
jgi:hypothetical protein